MSLSVGKLRGLQQCTTPDSLFVITALDHRQELRTALNPANPDSISAAEMSLFKTEATRALSAVSSAILLDPEFGAAQAIAGNAIGGSCGLIVSLEAMGAAGQRTVRKTQLMSGWGVEQSSRMGASAVKLLLYYHPEAKNHEDIEQLVREVAGHCRDYDMTFLLEPAVIPAEATAKDRPTTEWRTIVIESARRLSPLGADVLAVEFPVAHADLDNELAWGEACAELDAASSIPWVMRSGGVDADLFMRQTEVACRAGASGVVAGRTVWEEAVTLRGDDQLEFLQKAAIDRLVDLGDIISEYATPWTDYYSSAATDIAADWYETY